MPLLQPTIPSTPEGTTLKGRTIIITGGNRGLGREAARQCILLHASRVIITTRSSAISEAAIAALNADPEVQAIKSNTVLEAFELDLNDYQSGLVFSQRVKREVKELDILLCNAGANISKWGLSKSGHEQLMQGTNPRNSKAG